MDQIDSMWEVRTSLLLHDKLLHHEAAITNMLARQCTSLEMFLGSRFDELETALKAKVESYIAPKTDALQSLIESKTDASDSLISSKTDAMESFIKTRIDSLETFVNVKMNDMDTYITFSIAINDATMIAKVDAVEARLTVLVNPHLSDLDSEFGQ